jgi:Kelch motif
MGGRGKDGAMEANRAYQATRLYSTPPVYGERDERRETGDYGLIHMVITITKQYLFAAIMRYLLPSEAAIVKQTHKRFGAKVEAAEEQIVHHLHARHFSRVPLPSSGMKDGSSMPFSWTRYLHELTTNKSHKLLIMGGFDGLRATNRVDMMVIDDKSTKISWQECAPMIKNRWLHSAYHCQGQVLSVSSIDGYGADGQGTSERYDVLSQTAVELEHKLPIPNLFLVATAELDGKAFAIGGRYEDAATDRDVYSDRVFCLDNKRHRGQAGKWDEQEARLINARCYAAVATFQGKMWLAGGYNGYGQPLSSVTVLDPLDGSWQTAGNLTKARFGKIALFVINDDLYAAGGNSEGMWVEKRDRQNDVWQLLCLSLLGEPLLSKFCDGNRFGCALAACDSTIYFLGGDDSSTNKSWNSYNTRTNKWASQQEQYQDVATRQLPRNFSHGQAVCITPSEQISGLGTWTSYPDFVHQEDEEEEEA